MSQRCYRTTNGNEKIQVFEQEGRHPQVILYEGGDPCYEIVLEPLFMICGVQRSMDKPLHKQTALQIL